MTDLTHGPAFKPFTYVKGEGVRVVARLLQQGVVHLAEFRLGAVGVQLVLREPDVLPEAQAHHIQVLAAVTEGTCQLYENCPHKTRHLLFIQVTQQSKKYIFLLCYLFDHQAQLVQLSRHHLEM